MFKGSRVAEVASTSGNVKDSIRNVEFGWLVGWLVQVLF